MIACRKHFFMIDSRNVEEKGCAVVNITHIYFAIFFSVKRKITNKYSRSILNYKTSFVFGGIERKYFFKIIFHIYLYNLDVYIYILYIGCIAKGVTDYYF